MTEINTTVIDQAVTAVRAGNRDAYRLIVEQCERPLQVFLAAIVPDPALIDDILQETFVTAYLKIAHYQLGSNILPWLGVIARNHANNAKRAWARRHKANSRYKEIMEHSTNIFDTPTENESSTQLEALHHCLSQLGHTARMLITAHYQDGVSLHNLAAQQGKSNSWAKVTAFRARKALAACMQQGGHS